MATEGERKFSCLTGRLLLQLRQRQSRGWLKNKPRCNFKLKPLFISLLVLSCNFPVCGSCFSSLCEEKIATNATLRWQEYKLWYLKHFWQQTTGTSKKTVLLPLTAADRVIETNALLLATCLALLEASFTVARRRTPIFVPATRSRCNSSEGATCLYLYWLSLLHLDSVCSERSWLQFSRQPFPLITGGEVMVVGSRGWQYGSNLLSCDLVLQYVHPL